MMALIDQCNSEYWPLALLLLSFLAATLLPWSSEASLVAALACGAEPFMALFAASLGNCGASLLHYGLGRWASPIALRQIRHSRWSRWAWLFVRRHRTWALPLTVLPVVGDPINIAAGLLRVSMARFVVVVFGLRIGRYALIAAGFFS